MKNSKIKMRKTTKSTNPARNSVLQGTTDSVLSCYLKELSNYYITYKDKNVYLFHKDTQLMKNVLRIERR